MILSPKVLSHRQTQPRRRNRLSPEEDVLILGDELGDGDIDETLPADLWFKTRQQRAKSALLRGITLSTRC